MKKRHNPLFPERNREGASYNSQPVTASVSLEPVEASGALSPISHKPMRKVMCDKIPAYYDAENRLVLPMKA
jgi:hypothetical protein